MMSLVVVCAATWSTLLQAARPVQLPADRCFRGTRVGEIQACDQNGVQILQ